MRSLPLEEALTNVPAKTAEQTPWYSRFGKRRGDRNGKMPNQVEIADTYENVDVSFLPFDSYLIVFVLGEYMLAIDIYDYSL